MAEKIILAIIIFGLIVGACFFLKGYNNNDVQGNVEMQSTTGDLIREIPIEVESEKTFIVTYSTDRTGDFAIIIEDSVSGGCKFPSGKVEYKSVMLSTTQPIEIIAPSSGSCTFSGDYNFILGDNIEEIKEFGEQIVKIK